VVRHEHNNERLPKGFIPNYFNDNPDIERLRAMQKQMEELFKLQEKELESNRNIRELERAFKLKQLERARKAEEWDKYLKLQSKVHKAPDYNRHEWRDSDGEPRLYSENAMGILHKKAQTIDLDKVGVISCGLIDFYLNDELRKHNEQMIKYGVAQAMLQNLGGGMTEAALAVREIIPSLDLLDGEGNPLKDNNWVQPHPFKRYGQPDGNYYGMDYYSVYTTSKQSKNDQKVMIITGLEFLNGYNGVAAEEVQFWRKGVKLIDRIPIPKQNNTMYKGFDKIDFVNPPTDPHEGKALDGSILSNKNNLVYHNNMMILKTAIMFKKDDLADIKFAYSGNIRRTVADHDEIKLKGWVFEALGSTVMG